MSDSQRAIKQIIKMPFRRYCYIHDSLMIDENQCDFALWQAYGLDDGARACEEMPIALTPQEDTDAPL